MCEILGVSKDGLSVTLTLLQVIIQSSGPQRSDHLQTLAKYLVQKPQSDLVPVIRVHMTEVIGFSRLRLDMENIHIETNVFAHSSVWQLENLEAVTHGHPAESRRFFPNTW